MATSAQGGIVVLDYGSAGGDNETKINRLIDADHADNNATDSETMSDVSVTPASLAYWSENALTTRLLAWFNGGTITGLSIGDGNFTVDSSGNVTYKSAGATRTDDPSYVKLYEATGKGDKWAMWRAPIDGYISEDDSISVGNETIYEYPRYRPTYSAGYMGILWPSLGAGQSVSQGVWAYVLNVASTFSGMLKTSGTQTVVPAVPGTDYLSPSGTETVTNKALVLARVIGSGNDTLTAAEVSGTVLDNTGQHLLPVQIALPPAGG